MSPSVLSIQLHKFALQGDWKGLLAYLDSLSHSQFRMASALLPDELSALSEEDFWNCFLIIVPSDNRAYLMTFLKAAVTLYNTDRLNMNHPALQTFSRQVGPIDVHKILITFLPILRQPDEISRLLNCFCPGSDTSVLQYLMATDTVPAYYCLFQMMRKKDYAPSLMRSLCLSILKKQTTLAFNYVSIVSAYFGLSALPARFSLSFTPYEHSRIENSFDNFKQIMLSI